MPECPQKAGIDVTGWMTWFLACLDRDFDGAEETVGQVLADTALRDIGNLMRRGATEGG